MTTDYKSMTDAELDAALAEAEKASAAALVAYDAAYAAVHETPLGKVALQAGKGNAEAHSAKVRLQHEKYRRSKTAKIEELCHQLGNLGAKGRVDFEGERYEIPESDA